LRNCARDAETVLWRHLQRELTTAAGVLRDPKKKSEYDRELFPAGVGAMDQRPLGPIECGACAEVNAPTRAFCSGCGRPLTESCARCGAKNVSSETYCGLCGANLKAVLQERLDEFEANLQLGERLQTEGYFDDALVLLSGMLSTANAHLADGVEQAREMVRSLPERRFQTLQKHAADLESAQSLLEAAEYDAAVEKLEDVPPGLRDEGFEQLYADCRARRDETNELLQDIRAAVAARQTEGLLEKVDRLLYLKPGHPQVTKLRSQLLNLQQKTDTTVGENLRRKAKLLLSQQKYAEAVQVLEETPDPAREEEFQKLYDYAKETAWLSAALENAPVIDKALVMAAQRLCKLAPKDERAAQLSAELQEAARNGLPDPRHAAPMWSKSSSGRFPCHWLGGFRRLRPSETCDVALLRANPGRFYVACGLALQGLGLAAISTNLAPVKKRKGVLDSIALIARKQPSASAAWGLDLTSTGYKAVRLVRGERDEVRIDACELYESVDPTLTTGEDSALLRLGDELARFLEDRDLGTDRLCISPGGVQVLPRYFRIPEVEESRLRDAVTFEARHQIPFPLEELAWDFHAFPVSQIETNGRVQDREILVLAAKSWQLQHPLGALDDAGIGGYIIQSDAAALYNLLRYEFDGEFPDDAHPPARKSGERVLALLDVGRQATTYVSCSPRSAFFRTFPLGGDSFTRALVRELNLTLTDAEALKRAPWKARSMQAWDEALDPVYRTLMEEVLRSEKMLGRERRIERMYVSGGGAQLHGLLRRICGALEDKPGPM
jgi:type IV pilus assembly protein PilM